LQAHYAKAEQRQGGRFGNSLRIVNGIDGQAAEADAAKIDAPAVDRGGSEAALVTVELPIAAKLCARPRKGVAIAGEATQKVPITANESSDRALAFFIRGTPRTSNVEHQSGFTLGNAPARQRFKACCDDSRSLVVAHENDQ